MRKILYLAFVAMFCLTGNAFSQDYRASDGFVCAQILDFGKVKDNMVMFYFDKGTDTEIGIHPGCEEVYDGVIKTFFDGLDKANIAVDITGFASDEKKKKSFDNTYLSYRREEEIDNRYFFLRGFARRFRNFSGQAMDDWFGAFCDVNGASDSNDDPCYRSVRVLIIYPNLCTESMFKIIKMADDYVGDTGAKRSLIDDSKKKSIVEKRNNLINLCASSSGEYSEDVTSNGDEDKVLELAADILEVIEVPKQEVKEIMREVEAEVDISLIVDYINALAEIDRTVWRTKEGKFNTIRLVSDLGAAAVLGTVGGVVTSTVMKKNQLKHGFENLRCTIMGQDFGAGYGDEFVVTFQNN